MCNCMNETLKAVTAEVEPKLPAHKPGTLKIQWENKVFRLDGKGNDVMLPVSIKYRRTKSSGDEYKNTTHDSISMAMTYCPFCGENFDKQASEANQ